MEWLGRPPGERHSYRADGSSIPTDVVRDPQQPNYGIIPPTNGRVRVTSAMHRTRGRSTTRRLLFIYLFMYLLTHLPFLFRFKAKPLKKMSLEFYCIEEGYKCPVGRVDDNILTLDGLRSFKTELFKLDSPEQIEEKLLA
jgi:hypothetical protein